MMILDFVLSRYKDAMQILVQPTNNTFFQLEEVLKKWHQALGKIAEFTQEVLEEDKKEKKSKKDATKKGKKEQPEDPAEADAASILEQKLMECYAFQDDLKEVAFLPVSLVNHMMRKVDIRTDTPAALQQSLLQSLFYTFNHFMQIVNPLDSRNDIEKKEDKSRKLEFLNPRERALAKKMMGNPDKKTAEDVAKEKGLELVKPNSVQKTVKRSLTRRR